MTTYNQRSLVDSGKNVVVTVKKLSGNPAMIQRFREVLGDRAPQFLASVVSATNANPALMSADPLTVMASAMVAATLDLDVVPGLGFAALVPYRNHGKSQCQFQIMTKGLVQLALRSGQYKNINVGPIFNDEFDGQDLITGDVRFHEVQGGQRSRNDENNIAGYFAYIELVNGFRKTEFWTMGKIIAHGKRFSKSFDSGPWRDNFQAMARKTVLKSVLSHWGILSVKMAKAIVADQAVFHDAFDDGETPDYVDAKDVGTEGLASADAEEVTASPEQLDAKTDAPTAAAAPPEQAPRAMPGAPIGREIPFESPVNDDQGTLLYDGGYDGLF